VYVLETMSKPYATRVSSPRQRETGSTIQSCRRRRRTRRPTTRRYSDHRLRAGGWFVGSTIIPLPNHSRAEPIHHHLPCSVSVAAAVRLGWSSVARGLGSVSRHRQAGACAIKAAEFSHIILRAAGGFLPACLPCRDGGKGCGLS
jgi:hypothetical protein